MAAMLALYFEDHEEKFIQLLYAFIDRPRLVKRFINIYRSYRGSAPTTRAQSARFAGVLELARVSSGLDPARHPRRTPDGRGEGRRRDRSRRQGPHLASAPRRPRRGTRRGRHVHRASEERDRGRRLQAGAGQQAGPRAAQPRGLSILGSPRSLLLLRLAPHRAHRPSRRRTPNEHLDEVQAAHSARPTTRPRALLGAHTLSASLALT